MFFYSPLLTWIVLASFPFYIAISAGATPLFRRRLDEKFERGAENQAFLVESVDRGRNAQGDGGRAADAAALGGAACRLCRGELPRHQPGQYRKPDRAVHQQAGHGGNPLFRREAGHRRRAHRRRAGRLQHAGRPRQRAGAAPGADLAGFSSGAPVGRAAGRHPQHPGRADLQSGPHGAPGDPRRRQRSSMSPSAIASTGRKFCTTSV